MPDKHNKKPSMIFESLASSDDEQGSDFEKLMKVVKANSQMIDSLNQKFSDIKRDYTELKKKVDNNTIILNETQ